MLAPYLHHAYINLTHAYVNLTMAYVEGLLRKTPMKTTLYVDVLGFYVFHLVCWFSS